ncbi:MAG: HNH endonuclease [Bdellovibrionales bacterium]|nr:HNH endonuclease [Bdellovibrionales bacterium]
MKGVRFANKLLEVAQGQTDLPLELECAKNLPSYVIYSPVFQSVQRSSKDDHRSDYRTGLKIYFYNNGVEVGISSLFSPTLLRNFLTNIGQNNLEKVFSNLIRLSSGSFYTGWASKQLLKSNRHLSRVKRTSEDFWFQEGQIDSLKAFYSLLAEREISSSWLKDVGCTPPPSGKGLYPLGRGSAFEFGAYFLKNEREEIGKTVKLLTPLLRNFLSAQREVYRNSNLKRSLDAYFVTHKLEKKCARLGCTRAGNLAAAHIVPHAKGGSDVPTNGVWLCASHHREQEGKSAQWHKANLKVKCFEHTFSHPIGSALA